MRRGRSHGWALAWTLVATGVALLAPSSASAICNDPCGGGGGGGATVTTLHVTVAGSGTVSDGTTAICSAGTCDIHYLDTETASLTGSGSNGQSFIGFSGDCSGPGTCSLDMSVDRTVTASFADITPPGAPTITSPSSGTVITGATVAASISFNNGGDATTTSYLCRVDTNSSSGATGCTSAWNTGALATGAHTVYVWAKDAAGNISLSPASVSFKTVNLPDTAISGTPANGAITSSKTTAFSYESTINDHTSFLCNLDGAFVPCNADLGPMNEGVHTLSVKAGISPTSVSGGPYYDTTAATRTWTVDSIAPNTEIGDGPSGATTATSATFDFSGDDPAPGTALHFECKLDAGSFEPCTSGQSYASLAPGAHTFSVRAVDTAGNADASPATSTWTVLADADGDGFFTNTDCNDANAAVHPGAADIPGDGVDQDCSGADAVAASAPSGNDSGAGANGGPPTSGSQGAPSVAAKLARSFKVSKKGALVRTLKLTGVTAGAAVTLTCKGKGCAFKSKKVVVKNGAAALQALFKKKLLRPGAVIRITLTRPAMNGLAFTLTVKKRGQPTLETASV